MHFKDQAICLRAVNYSDTSQVVTLFCRNHGKVAAMAKGSRRAKSAFDGPIEVFSCGAIVFVQKESCGQLANLTEFCQQPRFRRLARSLPAMNAGLFSVELTEAFLQEHDPHPLLFDKLLKFLDTVQDSKTEPEVWAWLILYQIRLLEETGIAPVWNQCVNCNSLLDAKTQRGSMIYFSSRDNGLLCPGCEGAFIEKISIESNVVELLQSPAKLPKADFETLKKAEKLLIYHFTELMGKQPKIAKYFGK